MGDGSGSGPEIVIEPFADPAWADAHEKLSAEVAAGLAGLGAWLRRRAKPKKETPAMTSPRGKGRPPHRYTPLADARPISAKTAAPRVTGAPRQRGD